jgi:hypothetical protein
MYPVEVQLFSAAPKGFIMNLNNDIPKTADEKVF